MPHATAPAGNAPFAGDLIICFPAVQSLQLLPWRAGPVAVWTRANVELVAGEEPSPFERAAIVADSGIGVRRSVELGRWLAINVEITLSTHRDPEGEWIHLDVNSVIGPDGTGRTTILSDSVGDFDWCIQTLVVGPLELR